MDTSTIKKYLPLASVVSVKNNGFFFMIIGYTQKIDNTTYDYIAVKYPVGLVSTDTLAFFNHDNIDKIIYLGSYNKEMKKILNQVKGCSL